METNINPEELITLVQERGVLWDKTLNNYKDKQLKLSAWREVCCLLIPDFENLDEKERQACGKLVSTKWSNLDSRLSRDKSEEHPMLSFFKGVLPSVTSFDDDETLEFQSSVLSLIQKIKQKRESRLYSSNYEWHSQSRDHRQEFVYSSQNQNVPLGNQNIVHSGGYGYSTRQSDESASPASSQDSVIDFNNF